MIENDKIKFVKGHAIPLPGDDIDTDEIIPGRYLKCITFGELGKYAFNDVRFNEDGSKKKHPFNDESYKGASILIVNKNFGCGSSREHAPQSLMRYGIKAIIGESFAEIFSGNCLSLGIPIITAKKSEIGKLMEAVRGNSSCEISIDLENKKISYDGNISPLDMKESLRKTFIEGTWDTLFEMQQASHDIDKIASALPYLNNFKKAR